MEGPVSDPPGAFVPVRRKVLSAVLDFAGTRRRGEMGHCEITTALVDAMMSRTTGLLTDRPAPDDVEALAGIGARYALACVPLSRMLEEFQHMVLVLSRSWWIGAEPADIGVRLRMFQAFEADVERSRRTLSQGHGVALAVSGPLAAGRRGLADALLTGRPPDRRLVQAAGLTPARNYLVLCARPAAPGPAEVAAGPAGASGALFHRQGDLLFALLPASRLALNAPAQLAATGFARLAALTGVDVAGAGTAEVGSVPEAAREARDVLDIATACGRRGAVFMRDVLVERALVGGPDAVAELADVVSALTPWPQLSATMFALYDSGLNQSHAARTLRIARRTMALRLAHIHRLTGIHPTSARGVQIFLCALAARRTIRGDGPVFGG